MQISYSIKNLRRLHDTPSIEIRPITILVGRNSAGKSTYLRSLPLIRQSIETRSSAPILWWGDYVDFGDFATAAAKHQGEIVGDTVFSFVVRDLSVRHRRRLPWNRNYVSQSAMIESDEIIASYYVGAHGDKTFLKRISLRLPSENIAFDARFSPRNPSENSITLNDLNISNFFKGYDIERVSSKLFAYPFFSTKSKESSSASKRLMHHHAVFAEALERLLQAATPNNIGDETIQREVRRILSGDNLDAASLRQYETQATTKAFKKLYLEIRENPDKEISRSVLALSGLARSFSILEILDDELSEYFLGVGYIGPARAAGERFYRKQELEVSEISSDGQNFPMFLASLTPTRLSQFSEWVEKIFGYGIELGSSGGHISINLRAGSRTVNVTDTGYGVSQILPVLGMIWWASVRRPERSMGFRGSHNIQTLAIEQPELHLHPAHQAKLADVFAGSVQQSRQEYRRSDLRLVVETHSESLINRLGELIEDGLISNDDVQIVIFSAPDDINAPTKVTLASFNKDGALENWPFGFFNYTSL